VPRRRCANRSKQKDNDLARRGNKARTRDDRPIGEVANRKSREEENIQSLYRKTPCLNGEGLAEKLKCESTGERRRGKDCGEKSSASIMKKGKVDASGVLRRWTPKVKLGSKNQESAG